MRTAVLPWDDPLIGAELGLRVIRVDQLTPADHGSVEFYVPEFGMRREPIALMAQFPALAVVQALTAGVEQYLHALPAGAMLCSGRGIHDTSVAEHAVTLVLASLRDLPAFVVDGAAGHWDRRPVAGLADRRVTVLGAGGIGRAITARLAAFECDLTLVGRTARTGVAGVDELSELLPRTEVLIVCVPGDESTIGLIDARALASLPDGALVVNVGRGSAVQTDALLQELSSRRLSAALDVVDPEPLPPEHPLWGSGALITPHVAGNSAAFAPRAMALVETQLRRWTAGEPLLNQVEVAH